MAQQTNILELNPNSYAYLKNQYVVQTGSATFGNFTLSPSEANWLEITNSNPIDFIVQTNPANQVQYNDIVIAPQTGVNAVVTTAGNIILSGGATSITLNGTLREFIVVRWDITSNSYLQVNGNSGSSIVPIFTQDSVPFAGATGTLTEDNANFKYDPTIPQFQIGTVQPLYNFPEIAMNIGGSFGSLGSPDYLSYTIQNTSSYGSSDFVCANDLDDGTVLTGVYGDLGIAGSTYVSPGGTDINQSNDVYLYTSMSAGNLNIYAQGIGKVINFATAGDTIDQIRARIADDKMTIYANKDVELIPGLAPGDWTATGGWSANTTDLTLVSNAGPNTIEPSTPLTITPGLTYYVVIVASATSGTISYTLGGVPGTNITTGTTQDFLTATGTGNLIITGLPTDTATITSVSVRALIPNTGLLEVQGDLILGGGISTISGQNVATIDGSGVMTFSQIPFVPVALPTQPYQVASKYYVDTFAQGLVPYLDCVYATTGAINLATNGLTAVDTGAIVAGDRILVKDQAAPAENGIYIAAVGAWTRATDYDVTAEVRLGSFFYVTSGTVNAGNRYAQYLFNPAADTINVNPIGFTLVSQAGFGVNSFSFTNANGFAGVVSNPSTTPDLTLNTTVTGMIRGSAGALTAAGTGTDNHIIRYDGTNNIQDSDITLSDVSGGIVTFSSPSAIYFNTTTAGYEFEVDSSGQIILNAGAGSGGGSGYAISLNGGVGGATGLGGPITISGGTGGATSGAGAPVQIYGGSADPFGSNSNGGDIWLTPGAKSGSGTVGKLRLYGYFGQPFSANLDATGITGSDKTFTFPDLSGTFVVSNTTTDDNTIPRYDGTSGKLIQDGELTISDITFGTVDLQTKTSNFHISPLGDGNELRLFIPNTTAGAAGPINIYGGNGFGAGAGSSIEITSGGGGATGIGGYVALTGGQGGGTSGAGGTVSLTGGSASAGNSNGGNIDLYGGLNTGSGTKGHVRIFDTLFSTLAAQFDASLIATSTKTFTFPNTSGTFALTSNNLSAFAPTTSAQLASIITDETGTGALVFANNPAFTGSVTTTSAGGQGVGYATGAGGSVTQLTSKATAVTLNKICGRITMNAASLANNAEVSFALNNTTISATDVIIVNMQAGGTIGGYTFTVSRVGAGTCTISVSNVSGGALAEAIVLNFAVIKSVIV